MTYRKLFERRLGVERVAKLPGRWQRHIDRIDRLPKPKKKLPISKILEMAGA